MQSNENTPLLSPVQFTQIIVIFLGVCASLLLAKFLVDEPIRFIVVFLACCFGVIMFLWKDLYALVPLWAWSLPWVIPLERFDFSIKELVVPAALGILILRGTFQKKPLSEVRKLPQLYWIFSGWLMLLLLQAMYVGGFGLKVMGSAQMGGRSFLPFIIAISIFPVLFKGTFRSDQFAWGIIGFLLFGSFFIALNQVFMMALPSVAASSVGGILGVDYSETFTFDNAGSSLGNTRFQHFAFFGIGCFSVGYFNLRPWQRYMPMLLRMTFCIFGLALAGLSGHRIAMITILGSVFLNQFCRNRKTFIWLVIFLSLTVFLLVMGHGHLYQFPISVQRSLAFLPGNWDVAAVSDAEGTSKWRIEIWEKSLPIIAQKLWFGYGLAFSEASLWATVTQEDFRSSIIVMNIVHNGPLSLLIAFGVHGFIFSLITSGFLCYRAFQIRRVLKKYPRTRTVAFLEWATTTVWMNTVVFYLIYGGHNNFGWQIFLHWVILEVLYRELKEESPNAEIPLGR